MLQQCRVIGCWNQFGLQAAPQGHVSQAVAKGAVRFYFAPMMICMSEFSARMDLRVRLQFFAGVLCLVCAILTASSAVRNALAATGQLVLLVWISWQVAVFVVQFVFENLVAPLPTKNKCVIVSGNESEVGTAIIFKLCDSGFRVFACLPETSGPFAQDLRHTIPSNQLVICEMDRKDKRSIDACLSRIQNEKGSDEQIWGLVTFCGFPLISKIDWGNFDPHFNRVIEGDVIGLLHLVRECLPLLRESKGRIVNVTSVVDRERGRPFHSTAAISSSASHALMECVRREVAYFGIHAINIQTQCGLHTLGSKTQMQAALHEVWQATSESLRSDQQLERARRELDDCTSRKTRDCTFPAIANCTDRALRARCPEFKYQTTSAASRPLLWLLSVVCPDELRSCIAPMFISK